MSAADARRRGEMLSLHATVLRRLGGSATKKHSYRVSVFPRTRRKILLMLKQGKSLLQLFVSSRTTQHIRSYPFWVHAFSVLAALRYAHLSALVDITSVIRSPARRRSPRQRHATFALPPLARFSRPVATSDRSMPLLGDVGETWFRRDGHLFQLSVSAPDRELQDAWVRDIAATLTF